MLTPALLRIDGRSTEYYRTHPEARAKKVAYQAKRNRDPEQVRYRVELKRERRRRGIYGKGGPDVSHTESGRLTLEHPSKNRARNGHGGKPRLRADALRIDLKCGKGAISQGEKCTKGTATAKGEDKNRAVKVAGAAAIAGLATAAILNRKKWTAAANDIWKRAAPFDPANPPKGAQFLAQGNNGSVWLAQDRKSIIKIPKHKGSLIGLDNEVAMQIKLRESGVNTPEIFAYDSNKGVVHMEFLDGYKPLSSTLKTAPGAVRSKAARNFVGELAKTHRAGFAHGDLNYNNIMVKGSKVAVIDWGFAAEVEKKGTTDIGNIVRMVKDIDPEYSTVLKEEYAGIQNIISSGKKVKRSDIASFWDRVDARTAKMRSDSTARIDKRCGKSGIPANAKCSKPTTSGQKVAIGAAATGVAIAGLTAAALLRRGGRPTPRRAAVVPPSTPSTGGALATIPRRPSPTPSGPAQLQGFTPRALLTGRAIPKSKTQRMRENTAAAAEIARGRIAQTAREEARRIAQIGNTMAATGEATGMATKLTARNLRLRAEAARRRWEPGYRRPDQPRQQALLTEGGGQPVQFPLNASQPLTPQRIELDPRTGQPRRRRARGFGRQEG